MQLYKASCTCQRLVGSVTPYWAVAPGSFVLSLQQLEAVTCMGREIHNEKEQCILHNPRIKSSWYASQHVPVASMWMYCTNAEDLYAEFTYSLWCSVSGNACKCCPQVCRCQVNWTRCTPCTLLSFSTQVPSLGLWMILTEMRKEKLSPNSSQGHLAVIILSICS